MWQDLKQIGKPGMTTSSSKIFENVLLSIPLANFFLGVAFQLFCFLFFRSSQSFFNSCLPLSFLFFSLSLSAKFLIGPLQWTYQSCLCIFFLADTAVNTSVCQVSRPAGSAWNALLLPPQSILHHSLNNSRFSSLDRREPSLSLSLSLSLSFFLTLL